MSAELERSFEAVAAKAAAGRANIGAWLNELFTELMPLEPPTWPPDQLLAWVGAARCDAVRCDATIRSLLGLIFVRLSRFQGDKRGK